MSGLRWRLSLTFTGLVLLDRMVIARIRDTAAATQFRHEVGGVLVGSRRGPHFHIRDASLPQTSDRASPVRFWRRPDGHQEFVDSAWHKSKGHVIYLGEWHSHPEAVPTPSTIDRSSWASTVRTHGRPMVFVIVGTSGLWLTVEPSQSPSQAWLIADEDRDGILFRRCF